MPACAPVLRPGDGGEAVLEAEVEAVAVALVGVVLVLVLVLDADEVEVEVEDVNENVVARDPTTVCKSVVGTATLSCVTVLRELGAGS